MFIFTISLDFGFNSQEKNLIQRDPHFRKVPWLPQFTWVRRRKDFPLLSLLLRKGV